MSYITREQWLALVRKDQKKKHKYAAQKTVVDGISFPSMLEAKVFVHLRTLERGGALKELKIYDSIQLVAKNGNRYRYKPDFRAFDIGLGAYVWYEAKGMETNTWIRNKSAWKVSGPGRLEVWKANGRGIYLAETIYPKEVK